jgi:antitoxin (DNA-binding transcriptional repressor) of toxin-antitoxin stability system
MYAVGIRELKNRLSEYVRLAAAGERVLVTDRDRVVAELTAPRPGTAATVSDAAIADLVRRGLATPPLIRERSRASKPGAMKLDEILADLDTDRADR